MTTIVEAEQRATRVSVGHRVREWRLRREMSQADVARLTGITQASLSNYENGKRDISVWVLIRIAEELDVSIEDLTGQIRRRREPLPSEQPRAIVHAGRTPGGSWNRFTH